MQLFVRRKREANKCSIFRLHYFIHRVILETATLERAFDTKGDS